jgi:hypothetical protein
VHRLIFLILAMASVLSACSKNEPLATPAEAQQAASAAAAPQAGAAQNSGKVLQTQNGGGYTYAEVATASGQNVWIAGTQLALKPGDAVEWGDYAVMRNFSAKSLGRTFDQILFVNRWGPAGGTAVATPPHGSFPAPPAAIGGGGESSGVVKSVVDAGGYSYIEVDRGGATAWVAAMQTPMKPGDKIEWQGGTEMRNFSAKSLGRNFDRIIFASSVAVTH